jgi:L-amino acid N-acyltransferase YncA
MTARIRFAEPGDTSGVLAIYGPFCESSTASFETIAPTTEEMAERIARVSQQYPWLVCDVDGQVAGYVYACGHRERAAYGWSVEVTAYISTAHRRRGLGRALYTSLFSILRQQGYFKAFAGITLPNEASVALHEAMGFEPVGVYRGVGYKLGRWLDVGWWQKSLQPESADPPPPRPIGAIRGSDGVATALAEGQRLLGCR